MIDGLITVPSSFGYDATLGRLEAAIRANGMCIVVRVDHSRDVSDGDVEFNATTLMMFGSRSRQAELIKARRLVALELPSRILIWQHGTRETCLSYTDFRWMATRYLVPGDDLYLFADMAVTMDGIARKATSPP